LKVGGALAAAASVMMEVARDVDVEDEMLRSDD
jgi:hypothetical protein